MGPLLVERRALGSFPIKYCLRDCALPCHVGPVKTRAKNGEHGFLLRVASVAKRECAPWTNRRRPAPTQMIE